MRVYVFPGQGSQRRGMGENLFDEVSEFSRNERLWDEILGFSVRQMCLDNPRNRLNETRYTQPALYVVNAVHYYKKVADHGLPDMVVGHGLGEYNALLAAGAFDFATGPELVRRRGELMGRVANGTMAAVVGLSAEKIAVVLKTAGLSSVDVANYNSPLQTVLSGPIGALNASGPLLEHAGAQLFLTLPVSGAFNSRYMQQPANEFREFLQTFRFFSIPVIANATGSPYHRVTRDSSCGICWFGK